MDEVPDEVGTAPATGSSTDMHDAPANSELVSWRQRKVELSRQAAAARAALSQRRAALQQGLRKAALSLPRGTVLPERIAAKRSVPTWVQEVPSNHDLVWGGGFLSCRQCGATTPALRGPTILKRPCRGTTPPGSEFRLRSILHGKLPPNFQHWPDEGREALELCEVFQLSYSSTHASWVFASA